MALPPAERLSYKLISPSGIYLAENGENMVIWVGAQCSSKLLMEVFGIPSLAGIDLNQVQLAPPSVENPYASYIHAIIHTIRIQLPMYPKLSIVLQNTPTEQKFAEFMVEDKYFGQSYEDFLVEIHRMIQQKIKENKEMSASMMFSETF